MEKKEISSVKKWKEAFRETALCSFSSSHKVSAFPWRSRSLRLILCYFQIDIWKPIEGYGENGYPKIKTEKKLSEKALCVLLVHLKELQPSPKEAIL